MNSAIRLTRLRQVRYSERVTDKEVTEFGSSTCTRRISALRRFFFVRNAFVRLLQWAAVVGSLRAAGYLVRRSSNPAIRRPPSFGSEERFNRTRRPHAWH